MLLYERVKVIESTFDRKKFQSASTDDSEEILLEPVQDDILNFDQENLKVF